MTNESYDRHSREGIDRSKYSNELDYQRDLALYHASQQKTDATNLRDGIKDTSKQLDEINRTVTRVETKMGKLT
eukprot:CAMPEP_0176451854 /NCGR_PEP_ID=MMETSP0127-20121128/28132_1 /TAXON_ID=938130 /ORGANISM="Platyophrya macrostoma, Strain WH" /LENGTH=73 /DNA_ID=CAMNT_0017840085 /DNA_START=44 /DNA_END=261 /DNA_ORIENTATION=-